MKRLPSALGVSLGLLQLALGDEAFIDQQPAKFFIGPRNHRQNSVPDCIL
jgi:hypothetical protein